MAYQPEELKVIEKVIEEVKKLTKKYGYEYTIAGCTKYIKTTKAQKRLLKEIKEKEKEVNELKSQLG